MSTRAGRRPRLLCVEDNIGDVRLIEIALDGCTADPELHVCPDGESALRFLRREAEFENAARPDLVLLDLNLPGVDGREVLQAVKGDPELQAIPVVVVTSSPAPDDVRKCYALSANAYVRKPTTIERYTEVMRTLTDFWLKEVVLPEA